MRIKDIAQVAGVSVGTVDRVLHNRGKVSEDALKKVMAVLNQNEYKPNLIARMLGSNRSYRIAVLLPNPDHDPYWAITRLGVIQAESEWQNYGVQLTTFPFDMLQKDSFEKAADQVLQMNPDGVLIAPIFYHETLPFFDVCRQRNIPFVLFNTNIKESNALCFIGQNLYQSGRIAAELICIGQSMPAKFAVLHIDEDLDDSIHLLEKEKGFKDYVHESFSGRTEIQSLNRTSSSDFAFKKELAKLFAEPDLKGIFVSSSQGTTTVASFLKTQRKNNIRLIGYDLLEKNVEYLRSGVIDFLIHQKPQQQAFLGVSCLANHLVFKKETNAVNQFPIEVITSQNLDSYLNTYENQKNDHEQVKYLAVNI
jgi:LacI family transcriptional regulator